MAEMMARYLGKRVMEAFADDDVTEVYVNPQDGRLRLDTRSHGKVDTGWPLPAGRVEQFLNAVADLHGLTLDAERPSIQAELPQDRFRGARLQGFRPPLASAASFVVRKPPSVVYPLGEYARQGILPAGGAAVLRRAVEEQEPGRRDLEEQKALLDPRVERRSDERLMHVIPREPPAAPLVRSRLCLRVSHRLDLVSTSSSSSQAVTEVPARRARAASANWPASGASTPAAPTTWSSCSPSSCFPSTRFQHSRFRRSRYKENERGRCPEPSTAPVEQGRGPHNGTDLLREPATHRNTLTMNHTIKRALKRLSAQALNKRTLLLAAFALAVLLMPREAMAGTGGVDLPWNTPLQNLLDNMTGSTARILAGTMFVIGGIVWGFTRNEEGAKRFGQAIVSISLMFGAVQIVDALAFAGGVM